MAEPITTGKEFIDATQNAFIEAAENVAEMIDNPDPLPTHEHEVFYLSAEFWVAVAFVLTVSLISRPIYKVIKGMIITHIAAIKNNIETARQLQSDAEKLLASYEKKFRNIDKEADDILKKAQNEIEYIKKASISRMEQEMEQKEKDVTEKLQEAKSKALQEISSAASDLSIKATRKIIQTRLQKADLSDLIESSIEKIAKM